MEVKEDVVKHTAHCPKVGGADAVFVADAEPTLPPLLILITLVSQDILRLSTGRGDLALKPLGLSSTVKSTVSPTPLGHWNTG